MTEVDSDFENYVLNPENAKFFLKGIFRGEAKIGDDVENFLKTARQPMPAEEIESVKREFQNATQWIENDFSEE